MPTVNLNRLGVYAAVVDTGSFTAAAERLGITKAMVSLHVSRLEKELGVALLTRTTRRLSLTESGRQFAVDCERILHDAEASIEGVATHTRSPRGTLRLTTVVDYAATVVAPALARFVFRNPEVSVDLVARELRAGRDELHGLVEVRDGQRVDREGRVGLDGLEREGHGHRLSPPRDGGSSGGSHQSRGLAGAAVALRSVVLAVVLPRCGTAGQTKRPRIPCRVPRPRGCCAGLSALSSSRIWNLVISRADSRRRNSSDRGVAGEGQTAPLVLGVRRHTDGSPGGSARADEVRAVLHGAPPSGQRSAGG